MLKNYILLIIITLTANTIFAQNQNVKDVPKSEDSKLICDLYLCLPKKIANLPEPSVDLKRRGMTLMQQRKYGCDLLIAGFLTPMIGPFGFGMWVAGAVYVAKADQAIARVR